MDDFRGFPPGELRTTPIPDLFFSHVLPAMTDSAEIKVTLHIFWLCHRRAGPLRSVSHAELLGDALLHRSLSNETDWQAVLERGLRAALARHTVLSIRVGDDVHYAPNTATNRRAISAKVQPRTAPPRPLPPPPEPPSPAGVLYERYVGMVTPLIAQELAQAEKDYPLEWLADAFAEAAARGKRNWRYVQAILQRWASEGRR